MKAPLRILAVAALCVAALIGLVVREGAARSAGTEVLLAMEAVDPRALLMGHYVIVQLQETLPVGAPCPPGSGAEGVNKGWLALTPQGERHSLAGIMAAKEEAVRVSPLVARGEAYCTAPFVVEGEPPAEPAVVRYFLGFERFYIGQRQAERIERILREQQPGLEARVRAIVSIGRDHRARLSGLVVDGERFELEWF
jgi:GDYXXLXY protein